MLDIRNVGREALAETYNHLPLLGHELRAEASAAAVAPDRSTQRWQPGLRCYFAEALQVVLQLGLTGFELGFRGHMLKRAPAADAEMGTAGDHALGRGGQHLHQYRLVMLAVGAGTTKFDVFARQRSGDENGLAVADDALARVSQRGDRRGLDGL